MLITLAFHDMPLIDIGKSRKIVNRRALLNLLKDIQKRYKSQIHLGMEELTGFGAAIGHTNGAFTQGTTYGATLMAVEALDITHTLLAPPKWHKLTGRAGGDDKALSMLRFAQLFPKYEQYVYGPRGGAKDGRAEAALIGYAAYRLLGDNHTTFIGIDPGREGAIVILEFKQ